jgi:ketosteroid isomerase-like protein
VSSGSPGWEVVSARPADPCVRELWDREQIRAALSRYCRGIDRCDPELLLSAYHPDALDDHGVFRGTPTEFAAWAVAGLTSVEQSTTHQLTDVMVEVAGDVARSESRFLGAHVEDGLDGSVTVREFHGRYLDVLTCRDGHWRIAERRTIYDWTECRTAQRVHAATDPRFTHGARGTDDPVHSGWELFLGGGAS